MLMIMLSIMPSIMLSILWLSLRTTIDYCYADDNAHDDNDDGDGVIILQNNSVIRMILWSSNWITESENQ